MEHKRVDDLLRALAIVKKEVPSIKCKIVGYGTARDSLIKLSGKLDLSRNVRFLGYVDDHKEVIKIMKSSHILCHPGTVEGFGITLIESMACGTPYVCSNIDVFKEITGEGQGGLIFSAGNYEEMASCILKLLKNQKLYDTKVFEAKEWVKKYDWKIIVRKIQKVYSKIFKSVSNV